MVGLKIKKYLDDNGIKQAFLVEKTGYSASLISDICSGDRKKIDCIEYWKICKALGLPLEYFLEGEE